MVGKILLIIVLEVLYNTIYLEKSKGWLNKNYRMNEKFYLLQFYFTYYYYYYYCGAKGSECPGPSQLLSPKTHVEEERMAKEGPKLLGEIAENRHVLDELVP